MIFFSHGCCAAQWKLLLHSWDHQQVVFLLTAKGKVNHYCGWHSQPQLRVREPSAFDEAEILSYYHYHILKNVMHFSNKKIKIQIPKLKIVSPYPDIWKFRSSPVCTMFCCFFSSVYCLSILHHLTLILFLIISINHLLISYWVFRVERHI